MPSEQAMAKAREIVDAWFRVLPVAKRPYLESLNVLYPSIALALDAARRVPEGYVREGDTDRKVLGRLPRTADDCVVGFPPGFGGLWRVPHEYGGGDRIEQCNPMHMSYEQSSRCIVVRGGQWSGLAEHPVSSCYSTRAAAEAAKGGG